jgi:hypothetical protein
MSTILVAIAVGFLFQAIWPMKSLSEALKGMRECEVARLYDPSIVFEDPPVLSVVLIGAYVPGLFGAMGFVLAFFILGNMSDTVYVKVNEYKLAAMENSNAMVNYAYDSKHGQWVYQFSVNSSEHPHFFTVPDNSLVSVSERDDGHPRLEVLERHAKQEWCNWFCILGGHHDTSYHLTLPKGALVQSFMYNVRG